MLIIELSFHPQKHTLSSEQKSNEPLSDFFISLKVFSSTKCPFLLTVTIDFTFDQQDFPTSSAL